MADKGELSGKLESASALNAVDLLNLAAHAYNVGVIWMVQVSYRLWAYVGKDEFEDVHRAWWYGPLGIKPVFIPSAVAAFLGSFASLRRHPGGARRFGALLGIGLQVTTYASTAMMWGRWQGELHEVRRDDGTLNPLYVRLLRTHWLRVDLITVAAAVQFALALAALQEGSSRKRPSDKAVRETEPRP